jgi:alpha-L-fucosidase
MGQWTSVNGDAIYGTQASPFSKQLPWGRATSRKGKLYLHVFNWPADGKLEVPALQNRVKKAYLLADREAQVDVTQSDSAITLKVPADAPDRAVSIVVVEVNGVPKGR